MKWIDAKMKVGPCCFVFHIRMEAFNHNAFMYADVLKVYSTEMCSFPSSLECASGYDGTLVINS